MKWAALFYAGCLGILVLLVSLAPEPAAESKVLQRNFKDLYSNKSKKFKGKKTCDPVESLTFFTNKREFSLDDTDYLAQLDGCLKCLPTTWGYSAKEGLELFPPVEYPDCVASTNSTLSLDFETNLVSLDCQEDSRAWYYINSNSEQLVDLQSKFVPSKYTQPVSLPQDSEYALASCTSKKDFQLAEMHPRYKPEVHAEAITALRNREPITILHIALDSISRRHFFRKFPKTLELLNSTRNSSDTYSAFDFKMHSVAGDNSVENQSWVFSGISAYKRSKKGRFFSGDLWSMLRVQGFVSLFGIESCNNNFIRLLGKDLEADHVVNNIYCAASQFFGFSYKKHKGRIQRCIGDKMSHEHLLEYSLEFLQLYEGVSHWVYLHLDAGHEASGQHAGFLDNDLRLYLEKVMATDRQIAIFLEGDHGMRYGSWRSSEAAFIEHKLPVFFFLTKTSLLSERKVENLEWNAQRLTSKISIRHTTLALAGLSDKGLYLTKTRNNVTCNDLNIPNLQCPCGVFKPVPDLWLEQSDYSIFQGLLNQLNSYLFIHVNEAFNSSPAAAKFCKPLKHFEVNSVKTRYIGFSNLHIKVSFTVNEYMIFEAVILVGEKLYNLDDADVPKPIYFIGKQKARIVFISRLDPFEGRCEGEVIHYGVQAEYCDCKNQSHL
jgi:hypothetical protein